MKFLIMSLTTYRSLNTASRLFLKIVTVVKILLRTTLDDVASCSLAVNWNDLLLCRKMVYLIDCISIVRASMLICTVARICLIRMHAYSVQQNTFRFQSSCMPSTHICKSYGGR